jgi:hypothetical protein
MARFICPTTLAMYLKVCIIAAAPVHNSFHSPLHPASPARQSSYATCQRKPLLVGFCCQTIATSKRSSGLQMPLQHNQRP